MDLVVCVNPSSLWVRVGEGFFCTDGHVMPQVVLGKGRGTVLCLCVLVSQHKRPVTLHKHRTGTTNVGDRIVFYRE